MHTTKTNPHPCSWPFGLSFHNPTHQRARRLTTRRVSSWRALRRRLSPRSWPSWRSCAGGQTPASPWTPCMSTWWVLAVPLRLICNDPSENGIPDNGRAPRDVKGRGSHRREQSLPAAVPGFDRSPAEHRRGLDPAGAACGQHGEAHLCVSRADGAAPAVPGRSGEHIPSAHQPRQPARLPESRAAVSHAGALRGHVDSPYTTRLCPTTWEQNVLICLMLLRLCLVQSKHAPLEMTLGLELGSLELDSSVWFCLPCGRSSYRTARRLQRPPSPGCKPAALWLTAAASPSASASGSTTVKKTSCWRWRHCAMMRRASARHTRKASDVWGAARGCARPVMKGVQTSTYRVLWPLARCLKLCCLNWHLANGAKEWMLMHSLHLVSSTRPLRLLMFTFSWLWALGSRLLLYQHVAAGRTVAHDVMWHVSLHDRMCWCRQAAFALCSKDRMFNSPVPRRATRSLRRCRVASWVHSSLLCQLFPTRIDTSSCRTLSTCAQSPLNRRCVQALTLGGWGEKPPCSFAALLSCQPIDRV